MLAASEGIKHLFCHGSKGGGSSCLNMVLPKIIIESLEEILLCYWKELDINIIHGLGDNIRDSLLQSRGKALFNGTIINKNSNKNLLE